MTYQTHITLYHTISNPYILDLPLPLPLPLTPTLPLPLPLLVGVLVVYWVFYVFSTLSIRTGGGGGYLARNGPHIKVYQRYIT